MLLKASRSHLAEVGETFISSICGSRLLVGALGVGAGLACMLHAIVPALCERSCSRAVASSSRRLPTEPVEPG